MRIGIDLRMLNASGIGRYLRNLIYELQQIDEKNEYYLFLLSNDNNTAYKKNFIKVTANFPWYGYKEQVLFPKLLNKYNLDLMHFPHFNVPILYRGKFVVTIHDLTHLSFRMNRVSTHNKVYYEIKHQIYKRVLNHALKKSLKVIVVSNFVKNDLILQQHIEDSKVEVIYEGVDQELLSISKKISKEKQQQILKKFSISSPFLFYVGNAHPHKNLERLIKVFKQIKKKYPDLLLVLSGRENFFWKRLKDETLDANVIFTGFVAEEELVTLYKNASAFIFPSFSEGFGIPMLEAMAIGCPVISSDRTSLPEVGSDAAVYFNPDDEKDMEEKILSVLSDSKLKGCLVAQGLKRSRQFSWKKAAEQTLKIYENSFSS